MPDENLNLKSEYERRIQELERELAEERKKNDSRSSVIENTITETEELAKNLKDTTLALSQERQFALARAEKERLLSRWVERINSSFELDQVLAESIQELGQYVNADRCGVFIFNSEGVVFNEYSHVLYQREYDKHEIRKSPIIQKIIQARETLSLEELGEMDHDPFTDRVKSFLGVPVLVGEEFAGVLYLQQCNKPRVWNKREIELIETTALPLSTAIEKSRLYRQAKASTSQEELLNRLTTRIRSSLNLEEILARTVKELGVAANVSRCFIYDAHDHVTHEYCHKGVAEVPEELKDIILTKFAMDVSPSDPIIVNDIYENGNFEKLTDEEKEKFKKSEARSFLVTPLSFQQSMHGWIVFHNIDKREWTFDEVNFVESVASQVVVAITQSKMYEKLNAYQEKLSRELKQAARVQTALIGGDVFDACLETSVFYKAHSNVSGDFYWIAELAPHVIGLLIGDVSGKGPAAALLTGYLLGEFNAAITNSSMCWLPDKMINFLCRSILYQNSSSDFYATAWYGVFDLHTGKVTYCNGGHLNPYLIQNGKVGLLDEGKDSGVPLGLLDPKDLDESYELRSLTMNPGDKMVVFTDGVVDQKMPNGEFVPKDWIEKELKQYKDESVKEITIRLNERLNELSGNTPLSDDRLMVCLEQTKFEITEFKADDPQECDNLIKEVISECVLKGLSEERAIDLKLGLIEALTNAVRYGLKKNPYGVIKLGYRIAEGSFKMSLTDPGPGFNWQMYSHISIDQVGMEEEGGRGIPLLREIFDKVTWNPAGNEIGLFFYW